MAQNDAATNGSVEEIVTALGACATDTTVQERCTEALMAIVCAPLGQPDEELSLRLFSRGAAEAVAFYTLHGHHDNYTLQKVVSLPSLLNHAPLFSACSPHLQAAAARVLTLLRSAASAAHDGPTHHAQQ